jgi:hypothetical protein
MNILAEIKGMTYTPLLQKQLPDYSLSHFSQAFKKSSFLLDFEDGNKLSVSWWVSAKRTRSYPYARVYNTLWFSGKKVTIIPIFKDEGKDGDRDFLQWDTISLMSLLNVYVIIAYYVDAKKSTRYQHKITGQKFELEYIREELARILPYQWDALHWNLEQLERVNEVRLRASVAYQEISEKLGVEMHSQKNVHTLIEKLTENKGDFLRMSREMAQKAQQRESRTLQPKESLMGTKATITITNYLGGMYYMTVDEVRVEGDTIFLLECKHSRTGPLPSVDDIKDGLIKMILFTNISKITLDGVLYNPKAVLRLTTMNQFDPKTLKANKRKIYDLLLQEAELNDFFVEVN